VAQWTSQPPQEQQSLVRIPPGYKVFKENLAMPSCIIDVICIIWVFYLEMTVLATQKHIFKRLRLRSHLLNQSQDDVLGHHVKDGSVDDPQVGLDHLANDAGLLLVHRILSEVNFKKYLKFTEKTRFNQI
jgi:hypothetical protein